MTINNKVSTEDGSLSGTVDFLDPLSEQDKNPFGGMNLGIIEVETSVRNTQPTLQYSLE